MNLINFLKKSTEARKIFGKKELKIIEKQLLGINLTQSEKNRLSRDIRKKLEFIRDISKFSDEFNLKKSGDIKKMVDEAIEIIKESRWFPRIKKIILFGSTVENQRTFRSDVDIAVLFDEINLREATEFRIKTYVNDNIDIQVYNVLPEKIKREIDLKGKVLYERENRR